MSLAKPYPDRVRLLDDGVTYIKTRERIGRRAGAADNLKANIAALSPFYEVMIIDVQNKDRHLMQMVHDLSDEVHLMLRRNPAHFCTLEVWRGHIERPEGVAGSPLVIAHADRQDVSGDLDAQGYSIRLRPLLEAACPGGLSASRFEHPFEFATAGSNG